MGEFLQRAESRTSYPNALRVGILGIVVVLAIHWNACVYYQLSAWIGIGSDDWVYTPAPGSGLADHYFFCVYWSTVMVMMMVVVVVVGRGGGKEGGWERRGGGLGEGRGK